MTIPHVSMLSPALVPTIRATPWTPLLGATTGLLVIGAAVHASGGSPAEILALAAAVMAAALLAGLHDPAADLLEPLPVSLASRRLHRLLLLVPAAATAWLGLLALAHASGPEWSAGWPVGPLTALTAGGLAAATWAPPLWQVGAAVGAPLTWFALNKVTVSLTHDASGPAGFAGDLLGAWRERPVLVTAIALAVAALGWRR